MFSSKVKLERVTILEAAVAVVAHGGLLPNVLGLDVTP